MSCILNLCMFSKPFKNFCSLQHLFYLCNLTNGQKREHQPWELGVTFAFVFLYSSRSTWGLDACKFLSSWLLQKSTWKWNDPQEQGLLWMLKINQLNQMLYIWACLTCSFTRSSSYSCWCFSNSAMEFFTSFTSSSVENCNTIHECKRTKQNNKTTCVTKGWHKYQIWKTCTSKFSRLKMSPTARFCFITWVIFSLLLSRNSFTAFGLDKYANCCSVSFVFAYSKMMVR